MNFSPLPSDVQKIFSENSIVPVSSSIVICIVLIRFYRHYIVKLFAFSLHTYEITNGVQACPLLQILQTRSSSSFSFPSPTTINFVWNYEFYWLLTSDPMLDQPMKHLLTVILFHWSVCERNSPRSSMQLDFASCLVILIIDYFLYFVLFAISVYIEI